MMQIALVSRSGEALHAYLRFFEAHRAQPIHFPSISELYRKLPDMLISGLIVDMPTLVRAVETEKFMLQTIEAIFPSVRANWHASAGFQAMFHDSDKSGEENLLAFLQSCRNFKARALRKDKRKAKNFNVLFWPDGESAHTAERAYTVDVSRGGLFVCTCNPPSPGKILWVQLRELDERPFKLIVKWKADWGVALRIPGFGGMFVDVPADLVQKLDAALA